MMRYYCNTLYKKKKKRITTANTPTDVESPTHSDDQKRSDHVIVNDKVNENNNQNEINPCMHQCSFDTLHKSDHRSPKSRYHNASDLCKDITRADLNEDVPSQRPTSLLVSKLPAQPLQNPPPLSISLSEQSLPSPLENCSTNFQSTSKPSITPALSSMKSNQKKKNLVQLQLDLGQKTRGPSLCEICGLVSTIASKEDERIHKYRHSRLNLPPPSVSHLSRNHSSISKRRIQQAYIPTKFGSKTANLSSGKIPISSLFYSSSPSPFPFRIKTSSSGYEFLQIRGPATACILNYRFTKQIPKQNVIYTNTDSSVCVIAVELNDRPENLLAKTALHIAQIISTFLNAFDPSTTPLPNATHRSSPNHSLVLDSPPNKVYLYLDTFTKRITAVVTVQHIHSAHHLAFSDPDSSSSVASNSPSSPLCGFQMIWVDPAYRSQGVATLLLDLARAHLIYGLLIPKTSCAFTAPTQQGLALALTYMHPYPPMVYGTQDVL